MVKSPTATLNTAGTLSEPTGLTWLRKAGIALLGSLLVAAAAHVAVPLPWTPVPLTLQPMAVLLVGLLAGPSLGFATMLLYLVEGASGLPVFQPHGPGGLLQLAGLTGGFLWSYPVVALIAGSLFRKLRFRSSFTAAAVAGLAATAFLFTVGASQFAALSHAGARTVMMSTVLPFLPGEFAKIVAASGIAAWQARGRS